VFCIGRCGAALDLSCGSLPRGLAISFGRKRKDARHIFLDIEVVIGFGRLPLVYGGRRATGRGAA